MRIAIVIVCGSQAAQVMSTVSSGGREVEDAKEEEVHVSARFGVGL